MPAGAMIVLSQWEFVNQKSTEEQKQKSKRKESFIEVTKKYLKTGECVNITIQCYSWGIIYQNA